MVHPISLINVAAWQQHQTPAAAALPLLHQPLVPRPSARRSSHDRVPHLVPHCMLSPVPETTTERPIPLLPACPPPPAAKKKKSSLVAWLSLNSFARAGASAGRLARPLPNGAAASRGGGRGGGARSLVGASRPALANILIGDATDPVCESVFRSRGHAVDFKPGLSKVCVCVGCVGVLAVGAKSKGGM